MSWLLGYATTKFYHASAPLQLPLKKDAAGCDWDVDLVEFVREATPSCNLSPLLPGGHLQTLRAVLSKADVPVQYKRRVFESDHEVYPGSYAVDFVNHEAPKTQSTEDKNENCPPGTTLYTEEEWKEFSDDADNDTPLIIVLHGLSGGSHENYLRETLLPLVHPPPGSGLQEFDACVVNSRGCCYSKLTTPIMYNARSTWDMRQTARWAKEKWPKRPLFGLGFSLGANILVNYLGEEGELCPLDGAVVLSNPWDLQVAHVALQSTWIGREVYDKSMGASMTKLFRRHQDVLKANPNVHADEILASKYLWQFDRSLQAPVWGYPSETSYYRDASSSEMLLNVKVPLLAINAEDDPVTAFAGCPMAEVRLNPHAVFVSTSLGGHLGWFEYNGDRWMAKPTCNFFRKLAKDIDLSVLRQHRLKRAVYRAPNFDVLRRRLEVPIRR